METITGFVEHIVYRNEENGYTVLNLASNEEDEVTCVGVFQMISEGESLELTGEYTVHPSYGPQFKVQQYSIKAPEDIASIERYLGSGAIKGVGAALAHGSCGSSKRIHSVLLRKSRSVWQKSRASVNEKHRRSHSRQKKSENYVRQ